MRIDCGCSWSTINSEERRMLQSLKRSLPHPGEIRYEAIEIITIEEAGTFKNRENPRREKYPSSEEGGTKTWTVSDLPQAQRIMFEIELFGARLDRMDKLPKYADEIMAKLR